jgi:hypothetical protein
MKPRRGFREKGSTGLSEGGLWRDQADRASAHPSATSATNAPSWPIRQPKWLIAAKVLPGALLMARRVANPLAH